MAPSASSGTRLAEAHVDRADHVDSLSELDKEIVQSMESFRDVYRFATDAVIVQRTYRLNRLFRTSFHNEFARPANPRRRRGRHYQRTRPSSRP